MRFARANGAADRQPYRTTVIIWLRGVDSHGNSASRPIGKVARIVVQFCPMIGNLPPIYRRHSTPIGIKKLLDSAENSHD